MLSTSLQRHNRHKVRDKNTLKVCASVNTNTFHHLTLLLQSTFSASVISAVCVTGSLRRVLLYICWLCKQEWDCSISSVLMLVFRAARNGSYQVISLCILLSLSICPLATFPSSKSHLYCIRPGKIPVLLVLCENLTGAAGAVPGEYEDQTAVLKNNAVLVLHLSTSSYPGFI